MAAWIISHKDRNLTCDQCVDYFIIDTQDLDSDDTESDTEWV